MTPFSRKFEKNENPNRGAVSYDPNGTKRITSAGGVTFANGESQVFLQELDFEKRRWWGNEAELAEKEERNTPEWLTPIFFAADAYTNLCRIKDAASNFNDFIAKAADEPAYDDWVSQAKEALVKLPRVAEECHVPYP